VSGNASHASNQFPSPLSVIEPPVIAEQLVANAVGVKVGVADTKSATKVINTFNKNEVFFSIFKICLRILIPVL
jgi:hypothetical protein